MNQRPEKSPRLGHPVEGLRPGLAAACVYELYLVPKPAAEGPGAAGARAVYLDGVARVGDGPLGAGGGDHVYRGAGGPLGGRRVAPLHRVEGAQGGSLGVVYGQRRYRVYGYAGLDGQYEAAAARHIELKHAAEHAARAGAATDGDRAEKTTAPYGHRQAENAVFPPAQAGEFSPIFACLCL